MANTRQTQLSSFFSATSHDDYTDTESDSDDSASPRPKKSMLLEQDRGKVLAGRS